jgi:hypothetical protein
MKTNEFIEMYQKNRMIDLKKVLEVEEYVSIAHKQKIAELVLNECITEEDGNLYMDSLSRYILFTMAVINVHTNLEFASDDEEYSVLDDFDALSKNHLLEKIIETFKEDYDACQIVLDMMTSDKLKNHETLERKIIRFLSTLPGQFEQLQNMLGDEKNQEALFALLDSINKE